MTFFRNRRKDFSIQPPKQQVGAIPFFVSDSSNIDFTLNNLTLTADLTLTGVTAGTYGSSTQVPVLQIDQWGRVTGVTLQNISTSGLALETNGTPNGNQALLNLVAGTNMTITDDGLGNITFDSTGGGGGVASVNAGINISVTGTPTNPIINSLSDRYKTTSTTSNSVGNGIKTFTVDPNLSYIPLQEVLVVHNSTNHMHGEVVSYSGTTLVVDIKNHTGSGTYTSWSINLDGTPVDAITGSGTINELAYFTGGQSISSLSVVTYPNLTEVSYLKGVTSAVQTQLNSKVPNTRQVATTGSLTGGGDLSADRTLSLVNDSNSPGANKVYGTDALGVKGWKNDPSGGGNSIGELTGDVTAGPAISPSQSVSSTLKTNLRVGSVGVTVDGVTSVIQVGQVGYVEMPYAGSITNWSITGNATGSIVFDVWKASGVIPTVANTMIGLGTKPSLSSQQINLGVPTGWTTVNFLAGDILGFYVDSALTLRRATLTLRTNKS